MWGDGDRRINSSHLDRRSEDPLPDAPSRPAIEAIEGLKNDAERRHRTLWAAIVNTMGFPVDS